MFGGRDRMNLDLSVQLQQDTFFCEEASGQEVSGAVILEVKDGGIKFRKLTVCLVGEETATATWRRMHGNTEIIETCTGQTLFHNFRVVILDSGLQPMSLDPGCYQIPFVVKFSDDVLPPSVPCRLHGLRLTRMPSDTPMNPPPNWSPCGLRYSVQAHLASEKSGVLMGAALVNMVGRVPKAQVDQTPPFSFQAEGQVTTCCGCSKKGFVDVTITAPHNMLPQLCDSVPVDIVINNRSSLPVTLIDFALMEYCTWQVENARGKSQDRISGGFQRESVAANTQRTVTVMLNTMNAAQSFGGDYCLVSHRIRVGVQTKGSKTTAEGEIIIIGPVVDNDALPPFMVQRHMEETQGVEVVDLREPAPFQPPPNGAADEGARKDADIAAPAVASAGDGLDQGLLAESNAEEMQA